MIILRSQTKDIVYEITREDVLWLLRAIENEGKPHAWVAATLLNGYLFSKSKSKTGGLSTFTKFVRAYAQPINPIWFVNGSKYIEFFPKDPALRAAYTALAVTRENVNSTLTIFKATSSRAAEEALMGIVAIPYNSTDYAAPTLLKGPISRGLSPLAAPVTGENRFWSQPGTDSWLGFTNANPELVRPQLEDWQFGIAGGDFRKTTSDVEQLFTANDGGLQNRLNQTWINTKVAIPLVTGTYSAALAQKALQTRLETVRRAIVLQGVTRPQYFDFARKANAAVSAAWTSKVNNNIRITELALTIPAVVDAIARDPVTGIWGKTTNLTTLGTSTVAQPTAASKT